MKHFLSFIALFVLLQSASAQFSKGDKLLGGTVNFSNISSFDVPQLSGEIPSTSTTNTSFLPAVSFFTSSSLSHGIRLKGSFYSNKVEYVEGGVPKVYRYNNKSFGGGYFLRKYMPVMETLGFYGEVAPQFIYSTFDWTRLDRDNSGTEISLPIGTGLYYFAGKKCMLSVDFTLANISRSSSDWSGVTWETKGLLSSGIGFSGYYRF